MTELGTLGGPAPARPHDINDSGQVVGESFAVDPVTAFDDLRAFAWDGSMHDLGTIGGSDSIAYGINNSGNIVGQTDILPNNNTKHAFLYDGTMHDLGTLGGPQSTALNINNSGAIVGYADVSNQATHAFYYNGTMHDLGVLPGGNDSEANAVNNSGIAVGDSTVNTDPNNTISHAFVYDGFMHDLGTLGGDNSSAGAINSAGIIVGDADLANGQDRAFYYDGTMHNLGTLGGTVSGASDINDAGIIVGAAATASENVHGFIYQDGQMYDLNNLITNLNGMELVSASGINNFGEIIGLAENPNTGPLEAVILYPQTALLPEPASLALIMLGGLICRRRYR